MSATTYTPSTVSVKVKSVWGTDGKRFEALTLVASPEHTQPGHVGAVVCVVSPVEGMTAEDQANADRLAASWNACLGIPDPAAAIQAVKGILTNLYNDTEGYADGAPDASAHDKLCNHVAHHVKAALALLTPKP